MNRADEPGRPEEPEYYALVSPSRDRDNPDGLARRRFTPEGPVDESFRRDLTWGPTSAIIVWEHGDVGATLFKISEAEANALVERFRSRWTAADQ